MMRLTLLRVWYSESCFLWHWLLNNLCIIVSYYDYHVEQFILLCYLLCLVVFFPHHLYSFVIFLKLYFLKYAYFLKFILTYPYLWFFFLNPISRTWYVPISGKPSWGLNVTVSHFISLLFPFLVFWILTNLQVWIKYQSFSINFLVFLPLFICFTSTY